VINGTVSYVQQNPWIQNRTIRDNILFGNEMEEAKYAETIRVCQLERDLEILPAGDMTEIGEKGINLSGGQKARVSLARAVYADRDIVLMDDPISALDANVKKRIFRDVFMDKFKHKTRILVTHAVDFLKYVDTIVLLKEGEVILNGSYEEVKDSPYIREVLAIHKISDQTDLNPTTTTEEDISVKSNFSLEDFTKNVIAKKEG
jgi:ABC-type bacteriocin/lantibiotic exporter with double-glycine peptidase domain